MEVIEHHRQRRAEAGDGGATGSRSFGRRIEHLLDRPAVAIAIMASALAMTALAWLVARDAAASDARRRFERRGEEVQRALTARLQGYEQLLRGAAGLVAADPSVGRAGFGRYVQAIAPDVHLGGLQAVGLVRVLAAQDVAATEQAMRAEGVDGFTVHPAGGDGLQRSAIVGVAPDDAPNRATLGLDMLADPLRREALLRARDQRRTALSAVRPSAEGAQPAGGELLMALPVFREPAAAEGPAALRRHWGWVYASFAVGDLLRGIAGPAADDIAFTVRDGDAGRPFHASRGGIVGEADHEGGALERIVELGGRHWTITLHDRAPRDAALARGANLVGLLGLAVDLLLFWSLRSSMRRRAQAERRAARQGDQARARQSWLTAVSGLSPDAILVFTRGEEGELRLVFTNPAFSDWFGLHPEDLLGLSESAVGEWLDGLAHADNPQPLLAPSEATVMLAGPPCRVLRRGMREDGRQRVYYYRDVTRETEVERLKNEFLTTAAHELRTPLASVYGFSELLVSQSVDAARMARTIAIIHRQAGVLNHLVDELLDLARIDARGDSDFHPERVDLRQVAELAAEAMLRPGEAPRLQLVLGDDPWWVWLDAAKSRQALANVMSNAVQYSPAGTPVGVVAQAEARGGRAGVAVRVRDQGIGMTPEQCARAFERFYRGDKSGHILGAGLGLSIVKTIVELQHGEVSLHSAPGAGTTVTLWWPLAQVADGETASPTDTPADTDTAALAVA